MSSQGRLFVFEGMDSVGKTTLSQALAKSFNDRGELADWFAFPGRKVNTLGALVYDIHHRPNAYQVANISPLANQVLHVAAHIDAIEKLILPAFGAGKTVILDRFWWSTLIYGPKNKGSKSALLKIIEAEKDVWSGIYPTALFLVTRDRPLDDNLWNPEWEAMQREYVSLASRQDLNFKTFVIENQLTIEDSLSQITSRIDGLSYSA